jgi:hypothetical protein
MAGHDTGPADSAAAPAGPPRRHDPIREKYFRAVELAERGSSALFYIAGVLSFAVLLVEKGAHPALSDGTQIAFIVAVATLFFVDVGIRLYWSSWAADERRLDLLSYAYSVPLTHDQTTGYYNNNETDPIRKLGVAVLENSHFSRAIALRMLTRERIQAAVYVVLLLVFSLKRSTDLAFAATAALVVFSEHILSRWLRLEWLRARCDTTYNALYALFHSVPPRSKLHPQALQWFAFYETSKSNAAITLSPKVFQKLNPTLSAEWDAIKKKLNL